MVFLPCGNRGRCYCLHFNIRSYEKSGRGTCAKLQAKGCPQVVTYDLARCDMAEAVEDAFRYSKLVLATTTYNAGIFPFMREFMEHLTERNYQNRVVGLIENGSWAPLAAKVMKQMLEGSKNITFTDTVVHIKSALNDASSSELDALSDELCRTLSRFYFQRAEAIIA